MNTERIVLFQEAMRLEQERCLIVSDLDQIGARLDTIHHQLFTGILDEALAEEARVGSARRRGAAVRPKSRRTRSLKAKVLQLLVRAGRAGIGVEELAAELGVDVTTINALFQSALVRIPEIKRMSEGRYRLESKSPD